jgi:hypothetical protein
MGERQFLGEDLTRYTADMIRKSLERKDLTHMSFKKMNLRRADFGREDLSHACFADCSLRSANFKNANLSHTDFSGSDVRWAHFEGANLSYAKNITARMLAQANIDDKTTLPQGITKADIAKGVVERQKDKKPRRKKMRADAKDRRRGIGERREKERGKDEWI